MLQQLFTAKPSEALGQQRRIHIDDNLFLLQLQENFSREFPAYDMIEHIHTGDLQRENPQQAGHVARRWWEIRTPGWFGHNLGMLMLNIEVRALPDNTIDRFYPGAHNIHNRFHFITALHERLSAEHLPTSEQDPEHGFFVPLLAFRVGQNWLSNFFDRKINGQVWTGYGMVQGRNTLIEGFALPVTEQAYLSVSFTHAANARVQGRYFQEHSSLLVKSISETFSFCYGLGNPVRQTVEQSWHHVSVRQAVAQHAHLLTKRTAKPAHSQLGSGGGLPYVRDTGKA